MKLPYKWKPREYQKDAYNAWIKQGFKQLDLIWHRRAGKDSVCLHGTMVKMWQRPATYWHMLPQANQVRKAIWKAVNPHTGKRWIDEAFPEALREATNESEMFIKFINGSTWQCLGSDNYMGAIGSNPAGIVYSEWSLTNPAASGYLRPILAENDGWELKIGTPRGENHAYRTHMAGIKDNKVFAQMLTVDDTQMDWDMDYIKSQYIVEFGEDIGTAMFLQEFYCSFKAPVQGSIWGKECTLLITRGVIQ
jgi:phage terminase large subunit